jgi:hypothetical protein
MSNPLNNPRSFDIFTLDGVPSPGLSKIQSGGDRAETWQDQQAAGFAGAFTTFRGEQLSQISYNIELTTPDHFKAWDAYVAMLNEGKDRRPPRQYTLVDLRVAHNKITQVSYAKIGAQSNPSPGKWIYEVVFKENKKRKPIGGAPKGPRDKNEAKIEALNSENKALTAQRDAAFAAARAKK